jgi:hypothetical protein
MCVERNFEARSYNHCCSGKALRIAYSECVSVAFGIQHVMRMRRVVIGSLLAVLYFSIFSHKRHDFQKQLLNVKCGF